MNTLREAAQQALKAWDNDENGTLDHPLSGAMETLRTALAESRREWRGLTEEEIDEATFHADKRMNTHLEFARAIEAELKERNA